MATAERVVVELEARNGSFDANVRASARTFDQATSSIERGALDAERAVERSSGSIVRSTGQIAQSQRNLGYQFADIGASLASGSSPFIVLAQQAPQVANALEGVGGTAGRLAAFFSGPFGAALLAAGSVIGVLASKSLEASDAHDKHKKAADELKDAEDRLAGASARANNQTELGIRIDIARANSLRQREIQTRKTLIAELSLAQGRLATADNQSEAGTEGGINFGVAAGATQERAIARITKAIGAQTDKIKEAGTAIRAGEANLSLRNIAGATDKATGANQRYENSIDRLRRARERGAISQAQFDARALKVTQDRDATLAGLNSGSGRTRRASSARNAGGTATAAVATTQDLLDNLAKSLRQIDQQFDKLFVNGKDFTEKTRAQFKDIIGNEGTDYDDPFAGVKDSDRQRAADLQIKEEGEQQLQARRADNVRSLADLYESLFQDGTSGIWRDFKDQGLRTLALIAAQATLASFSKGGGGIGSLLGNLGNGVSSLIGGGGLPKLAGGGNIRAGGAGGVDQNVLSVNGVPKAMISAHETLSVVNPNMRAAAPAVGSTTIVNAPQFNLKGAVVTRELYRDMQRISQQSAAQAGGVAYQKAVSDTPVALNKKQTLGT
jgi:hypothetical protein